MYFSIHAFGLTTAADQYFAAGADQAAVLRRTETVLIILGRTAFTAQAMLGLSIALAAIVLARSSMIAGWLAWTGVAAGIGWSLGALMVNFDLIVPFRVLTWGWIAVLAVVLWRRAPDFR